MKIQAIKFQKYNKVNNQNKNAIQKYSSNIQKEVPSQISFCSLFRDIQKDKLRREMKSLEQRASEMQLASKSVREVSNKSLAQVEAIQYNGNLINETAPQVLNEAMRSYKLGVIRNFPKVLEENDKKITYQADLQGNLTIEEYNQEGHKTRITNLNANSISICEIDVETDTCDFWIFDSVSKKPVNFYRNSELSPLNLKAKEEYEFDENGNVIRYSKGYENYYRKGKNFKEMYIFKDNQLLTYDNNISVNLQGRTESEERYVYKDGSLISFNKNMLIEGEKVFADFVFDYRQNGDLFAVYEGSYEDDDVNCADKLMIFDKNRLQITELKTETNKKTNESSAKRKYLHVLYGAICTIAPKYSKAKGETSKKTIVL